MLWKTCDWKTLQNFVAAAGTAGATGTAGTAGAVVVLFCFYCFCKLLVLLWVWIRFGIQRASK